MLWFFFLFLFVLVRSQTVPLGTASFFGALPGSGITNTGPSVVNGLIGSFPTPTITGFPPGIALQGIASSATTSQAQTDLTTAYVTASGFTPQIIATELGGTVLGPGVYKSATGTFQITGPLTLTGAGSYVFQMESTLITASSSLVILLAGAQASNIVWQVGSSATLGTGSSIAGNIIALTSITCTTLASVDGRLLAQNGAVTLDTCRIRGFSSPSSSTGSSVATGVGTGVGTGFGTGVGTGTGSPMCAVLSVPHSKSITYCATVVCASGYVLSSTTLATCSGSGWTHVPTCNAIPRCPPLPVCENGVYVKQKDLGECDEGQSLRIRCQANHDCDGDDTITCRNGQWDKAPRRCVRGQKRTGSCAPLAMMPHGHWNSGGLANTKIGIHNYWHCDEGYVSIPPNAVLTCRSNSNWDNVVPLCRPA